MSTTHSSFVSISPALVTKLIHRAAAAPGPEVRRECPSSQRRRCRVVSCVLSAVQRWKTGKRKAEKDEFLGGKMFITIRTPSHLADVKAAYVKPLVFY